MNTVLAVGIIFSTLFLLTVQGCSSETRGSVKELGNDIKRDIHKTAQDVDRKVQDAAD